MDVLSFEDYQPVAASLASILNRPCKLISRHRFPDGESMVQLPLPLSDTVIICQSLHHPNDKLIELLLACKTARKHGVSRIILAAPYLCYMRQDMAFEAGQAVSQQIIGRFLGELVNDVITIDPHLHRISSLQQAIPIPSAHTLSAASLMGEFLTEKLADAILVGPDAESEQWVSEVAIPSGFEFVIARKQRFGDRHVEITLPAFSYAERTAVLVDDVISSGHTLAATADRLKSLGCRHIHAVCTHALLAEEAERLLKNHGIETLWSTDTILHPSNAISVAPLLAEKIAEIQHR